MLTKIFSGLLGLALVLASAPVDARTIWIPGKTSNGERLTMDTSLEPYNDPDGMTYFNYSVVDIKGNFRDNMAMTNWCYLGRVQRNPKPVRYNMTKPGWVIAFDNEFIEITADSKASINLLKAVCAVVNQ
ncbi:hypothetical protein NIES4103_28020 [Nostoc sp. NIES-4103]|nr:hypothetical protein NIES4103_28020 [Nostoc sp. NIES-4103]